MLDVAIICNDLGNLLKHTNRPEEARLLLLEALDICTEFEMKEAAKAVEKLLQF